LKYVLGISLGSSRRDYEAEVRVGNQAFRVKRVGTDGDLGAAAGLIRHYDGLAAAFGLGGVNLWYRVGNRRYPLPDGQRLARMARETPVVDGSGLKEGVEPALVTYLRQEHGWSFEGRRVLLTSALDRWDLAQAFEKAGARLLIGDPLFGLRFPLRFHSLETFAAVARFTLPVLRHLPIHRLYPVGKAQEEARPGFRWAFEWAEIVAGDFHFVRRYAPDLEGKTVIASTVTAEDAELLRQKGAKTLVSIYPCFGRRAFGANVVEALLVAVAENRGGRGRGLTPQDLGQMYWNELRLRPQVIPLASRHT